MTAMEPVTTATESVKRNEQAGRPFLARIPWYAYAGAALTITAWIISWNRIGTIRGLVVFGQTVDINIWGYTFFPLWFGFILFLDGINVARTGTSPLRRGFRGFVVLFILSMPFWWLFEVLNIPVQNWHYILDRPIPMDQPLGWLEYHTISSIDFSTVLPAVMEMAELLAGFAVLRPRLPKDAVGQRLSPLQVVLLMAIGVVGIILTIVSPTYAFGLVWLGPIFLIDPINNLAGVRSAFGRLLAGDWRFIAVLALGALFCGFFWELWNSQALPKWYYTVPLVGDTLHLGEMPLPGYLGYLPFGVELFSFYQFVLLILGRRKDNLGF